MQSVQQLEMDVMRSDERKIFATTKEDLEQRQVPVIKRVQRTVDVPLVQCIDTIVGVPVGTRRQA